MESEHPLLYIGASIAVRFWLLRSDYNSGILDRVELATPLNSWRRVQEGVVLHTENIDPYEGDLFHRMPIELIVYSWILQCASSVVIDAIFILCDLFASFILYKTTELYLSELKEYQEKCKSEGNYTDDEDDSLISKSDSNLYPKYVLYAYLFNPYLILNCAARTTTVFSNLFLSLVLFTMVRRKIVVCCVILAICTLDSFYPWILLVPVFLYYNLKPVKKSYIWYALIAYISTIAVSLGVSYTISGSWNFLKCTLLFILTVPDLKPNIGIFWYFFTEMFEHFRSLFLWSFQVNTTVLYLYPLAVRFKNDPMLLAFSLISMTAIFKSYPSLGDVGFYLSLIPMWKHLFGHMQQGFMVLCFFIVCTIFAPTVWHLWIYSGSANANFYFGVTLAFATAQVFLLTDIMFAHTKWQFTLKYGKPKSPTMKLILK